MSDRPYNDNCSSALWDLALKSAGADRAYSELFNLPITIGTEHFNEVSPFGEISRLSVDPADGPFASQAKTVDRYPPRLFHGSLITASSVAQGEKDRHIGSIKAIYTGRCLFAIPPASTILVPR